MTTSPDGKCTLRILGPIALAGKVEWYELTVESGGVLASEPHEAGAKEHLSVLSGTLTVQAADSSKVLKAGDSARYAVDVQHAISKHRQRPGQGSCWWWSTWAEHRHRGGFNGASSRSNTAGALCIFPLAAMSR